MIDQWINAFYRFVNGLGYHHPLHPALVHMPIGLVIGAFVFAWTALLFKRQPLALSARYCIMLAFLFWFPVVLFGFTDWWHLYHGAWLLPITVKLVLSGILVILLAAGLFLGSKGREGSRGLLAIYSLCLLTVIGLGYFGAQLVYTNKAQAAPEQYKAGERLFQAKCSVCHPRGGNVIKPDKPLINAPAIKELKTFVVLIRRPVAPMPAFGPSDISDQQADELYRYIVHVLEKQQNPAQ
jgi:uncharacterized membrane protein